MCKMNRQILLIFIALFLSFLNLFGAPLVKILPSGTTLLIENDPYVDIVQIFLLIDKTPFTTPEQQIAVTRQLRKLEYALNPFDGIVQVYPEAYLPEQLYDFKKQSLLLFKISSQNFDENRDKILDILLGQRASERYLFYDENRILQNLAPGALPQNHDSLKALHDKLFNNRSKHLDEQALKKHMYILISGNFDVFQVLNTSLRLTKKAPTADSLQVAIENNFSPKTYWLFVLRAFLMEKLKNEIAKNGVARGERIFAIFDAQEPRIFFWTKNGLFANKSYWYGLIKNWQTAFVEWYKNKYPDQTRLLEWNTDQRAMLQLFSQCYLKNFSLLRIAPKPDTIVIGELFQHPDWYVTFSKP